MDNFKGMSGGISGPATRHFEITPANADLAVIPRVLRVLTAGDLEIRDENGVDVTYPAFAGETFVFRAIQVRTGTTATVVGWD